MVGHHYKFDVYPIIDNSTEFAPVNFLDVTCIAFSDTTKICIEGGCFPIYTIQMK